MNAKRTKQVLEAAGKLPPAKGRALISAVVAKAGKPSAEERIRKLEQTAADAMAEAMLIRMEEWISKEAPKA